MFCYQTNVPITGGGGGVGGGLISSSLWYFIANKQPTSQ